MELLNCKKSLNTIGTFIQTINEESNLTQTFRKYLNNSNLEQRNCSISIRTKESALLCIFFYIRMINGRKNNQLENSADICATSKLGLQNKNNVFLVDLLHLKIFNCKLWHSRKSTL